MSALHLHRVDVRRGRRTLLRGVELELDAGDAALVTGPNASGKSSLLRVAAGLLAPAAGDVARGRRIAYVPERMRVLPGARVHEWLAAVRRLRGMAPVAWAGALEEAGLPAGVGDRRCAELSKGTLQRVVLVEALAAAPALLVLDEPLSGLDAAARAWLEDRLHRVREDGTAVLAAEHGTWLPGGLALAIRDGRLHPGPAAAARVRIVARLADGTAREEVVDEHDSDRRLVALVQRGAHIEAVQRLP